MQSVTNDYYTTPKGRRSRGDFLVVNIRPLREAAGLSVAELARAVGVSGPAISMIESGKNTPSADKLPLLADALGCSIDALFGRGEKEVKA